jgi:hypothetical protein
MMGGLAAESERPSDNRDRSACDIGRRQDGFALSVYPPAAGGVLAWPAQGAPVTRWAPVTGLTRMKGPRLGRNRAGTDTPQRSELDMVPEVANTPSAFRCAHLLPVGI